MPSFPFFALACAMLVGPYIEDRIRVIDLKSRGMRLFSVISVCTALAAVLTAVYSIGRIGRDHDKLVAVYAVRDVVPARTRINVCPSMHRDWALHAYLARHARVTIERDDRIRHTFLLSDGSCVSSDSVATSLDFPASYSLYRQAP